MHFDQNFEELSTERPTTSRRDPEQVLHEVFGYETFRPLQGDIIREVVDGRDALVLMPTGVVNPCVTRCRPWFGPVPPWSSRR